MYLYRNCGKNYSMCLFCSGKHDKLSGRTANVSHFLNGLFKDGELTGHR